MTFSVQSALSFVINSGDAFASRSVIGSISTLSAGTTPPATMGASFRLPLVSGSAHIDLTALPGKDGVTQNGTGLKVQRLLLKNDNGPAGHSTTIIDGASNGYPLIGSLTLSPGELNYLEKNDTAHDVDSTHKTIDVTGTGSEELIVEIALG